jgi:malonyl-ACP decarboxylase
MDGNRNPDPSLEGATQTIQNALGASELSPADIDYVNPHSTGSIAGDETELKALHACGLTGAYLNADQIHYRSWFERGGTVEVITTLLQMKAGRLHLTCNLENPNRPGIPLGKKQVD